MKHLKLFETKDERKAFVLTADNTPNVNFCEEDGIVGYQEAITPKDPKLTRWYNGDTLIKELDVVGTLISTDKETSVTRCEIGTNVTNIGGQAFWGCSGLRSIDIPNSVTAIGSGAFQNCISLTYIEIPNSVTVIQGSFYGCTSLASVTYNGITYTSKSALTTALTNNGITLGRGAFDNTALTD